MTLNLLFDEPYTMGKKTNCHHYYLHASTGLAVYARLSITVVSSAYNSIASFTFEGNVRPCSFINVSTISKKFQGGRRVWNFCILLGCCQIPVVYSTDAISCSY